MVRVTAAALVTNGTRSSSLVLIPDLPCLQLADEARFPFVCKYTEHLMARPTFQKTFSS